MLKLTDYNSYTGKAVVAEDATIFNNISIKKGDSVRKFKNPDDNKNWWSVASTLEYNESSDGMRKGGIKKTRVFLCKFNDAKFLNEK